MSDVRIKHVGDGEQKLPIFKELESKMEAVRERAYDLFSSRGGKQGRDLDDWITAERELIGSVSAELKDHGKSYDVHVTLPGFTPNDVELTATPNELIIHASRKDESAGETDRIVWSEFGSSEIYRRFALPTSVEANKVSAQMKNGILKVHAPKLEIAATQEHPRIGE